MMYFYLYYDENDEDYDEDRSFQSDTLLRHAKLDEELAAGIVMVFTYDGKKFSQAEWGENDDWEWSPVAGDSSISPNTDTTAMYLTIDEEGHARQSAKPPGNKDWQEMESNIIRAFDVGSLYLPNGDYRENAFREFRMVDVPLNLHTPCVNEF